MLIPDLFFLICNTQKILFDYRKIESSSTELESSSTGIESRDRKMDIYIH